MVVPHLQLYCPAVSASGQRYFLTCPTQKNLDDSSDPKIYTDHNHKPLYLKVFKALTHAIHNKGEPWTNCRLRLPAEVNVIRHSNNPHRICAASGARDMQGYVVKMHRPSFSPSRPQAVPRLRRGRASEAPDSARGDRPCPGPGHGPPSELIGRARV